MLYLYIEINNKQKRNKMKTTSLKHYKELKAKGINVQLVTKQDLNPKN